MNENGEKVGNKVEERIIKKGDVLKVSKRKWEKGEMEKDEKIEKIGKGNEEGRGKECKLDLGMKKNLEKL